MRILAATIMPQEPISYTEAIASDEKEHWLSAIDVELKAHAKNNTWSIVIKPPGVKEISAKWVFKRKLAPNNEIERYKARLVARVELTTLRYFRQSAAWTAFACSSRFVLASNYVTINSILLQHF